VSLREKEAEATAAKGMMTDGLFSTAPSSEADRDSGRVPTVLRQQPEHR